MSIAIMFAIKSNYQCHIPPAEVLKRSPQKTIQLCILSWAILISTHAFKILSEKLFKKTHRSEDAKRATWEVRRMIFNFFIFNGLQQ